MSDQASNAEAYVALAELRASAVDLIIPAACMEGAAENVAVLEGHAMRIRARLSEVDASR